MDHVGGLDQQERHLARNWGFACAATRAATGAENSRQGLTVSNNGRLVRGGRQALAPVYRARLPGLRCDAGSDAGRVPADRLWRRL